MALALTRPHHLTRRAAATGLAALLLTGLTATGALAAPSATVVLDPTSARVWTQKSWTNGVVEPTSVGYGGTLTVRMPAGAHLTLGTPLVATLSETTNYAVAFSTEDGDLTVTDLGGGVYEVDIPDTTAFGTSAPLTAELVMGPGATDITGAATYDDRVRIPLDLSAGGPVTADADLDLVLFDIVAGPSVTAGSTVDLTVPAGSVLDQLGLTSLVGADIHLYRVPEDWDEEDPNGSGDPGGEVALPAHQLSADGRTATVTIPAGTPATTYSLWIDAAAGDVRAHLHVTFLTVVEPAAAPVTAAPVAPAPVAAAPVRNAGLRSATGWEDHVTTPADQGGTPWLALGGAAALLTAGAVTTATLRSPRRRTTT